MKKKFLAQQSVKKVMLTVFWDIKESITIDILEKGATINSASYCRYLSYVPPAYECGTRPFLGGSGDRAEAQTLR